MESVCAGASQADQMWGEDRRDRVASDIAAETLQMRSSMPPKARFTKEQIIDAAYELMMERGIEAVVAREVGKRMNATTTPIFTYFEGMDEVKGAVYDRTKNECMEYLRESLNFKPAFKEFGMRWINYAKQNPNAYAMLFMREGVSQETKSVFDTDMFQMMQPMIKEMEMGFGVSHDGAVRVVNDMIMFSQGIAIMLVKKLEEMTDEQISSCLTRVYFSCIAGCLLREGKFKEREQMIQSMLSLPAEMPKESDAK